MPESGTVKTAPLEVAPAATPTAASPAEVLRDDEIIELSIKPSHWYILYKSVRTVLAMALLAAGVAIIVRGDWGWGALLAIQATTAIALIRIALATLQWASRLYVLTNRRVMCFEGVLEVTRHECPLDKISAAELHIMWYQSPLRLGSIYVEPAAKPHATVAWKHVKTPREVHERLLRAIRHAQSGRS